MISKPTTKEIAGIIYHLGVRIKMEDYKRDEFIAAKEYSNASYQETIAAGICCAKKTIMERYNPQERIRILTEVENIRKRVEGN